MNDHFPDHSSILFGRRADLAWLLERSRRAGVTALVGEPQLGKSWLLMEVARRLAIEGWPEQTGGALSLLGRPPLVGRVETQGEYADMLPRAVQDLYTWWLSDSSYREQAAVIFEQNRPNLVSRVGMAVGVLVKACLPGKEIAALVEATFRGLASVNDDLKTGSMQLPRLQLETSRELLRIVFDVTKRPAVLVLDQWEKSPDLVKESSILDTFLRAVRDDGEWPPCHIFIGSRPDDVARLRLEELSAGYPERAYLRELGRMALADPAAAEEMLAFLRTQVPITQSLADEDLLQLISGNPAVIDRWTNTGEGRNANSRATLAALAAQAHAYNYPEFGQLLRSNILSEEERALDLRLALLPGTSEPEAWKALRECALGGSPGRLVDSLRRKGVLARLKDGSPANAPPSYGHAKRAEAALACYTRKCYEELREIGESLVISLAAEVRDNEPRGLPFASSLIFVRSSAVGGDLSAIAQALCESAYAFYQLPEPRPAKLFGLPWREMDARVLLLLAMGMNNTMIYAKQANELERRDALLGELRSLAESHPSDAALLEPLARGLRNTLLHVEEENDLDRRDALLVELRSLSESHPRGAAVRKELAKGLNNTLVAVAQENNLERRDALLIELRSLAESHPGEAALRETLADGLYNTLNCAKQKNDLRRRDALLGELRSLAESHPREATLREPLAMGLCNTLLYAKQEGGLYAMQEGRSKRGEALLGELRSLSEAHPGEAVVRESLAKSLYTTLCWLVDAKRGDDLERRDDLLDELQVLHISLPADSSALRWYANALKVVWDDLGRKGDLADSYCQKLRALLKNNPDDAYLKKLRGMIRLEGYDI